jgi:prophage regulatory protein
MKKSGADHIVGMKQAAELIGVSIRTLERLCRAGTGPRKIRLSPGRVGFRRSDIAEWLADREAA